MRGENGCVARSEKRREAGLSELTTGDDDKSNIPSGSSEELCQVITI